MDSEWIPNGFKDFEALQSNSLQKFDLPRGYDSCTLRFALSSGDTSVTQTASVTNG